MGREATCTCNWAGTTVEVKALRESTEIILRGDIRKRIPFDQLHNLQVKNDRLCFTVFGDPVELTLGATAAEKWASAIRNPPTLAKKLGIASNMIVRTLGAIDDEALSEALTQAAHISAKDPHLIVARVDTPEDLQSTLREARKQLLNAVPIWLIYPKGPGHPLNETSIRSLFRATGMMDTKVASVSAKLTALRFNLREEKASPTAVRPAPRRSRPPKSHTPTPEP